MSKGDEVAGMMQLYPEFEAFIEGIATAYFQSIVYRRWLPAFEPAPYPFEDTDYRNPLR